MIPAVFGLLAALGCSVAGPEGGATVLVRCGRGEASANLEFPAYGGPSAIHVVPGASETYWVVRSEAGGSDVHFWWLPLRTSDGRLVPRLRAPIKTTSQDAVCARDGEFAGVLGHLWEGHQGESHYAPHRYEFTSYATSTADMYVRSGQRRTRSRHESWRTAAAALGLECDNLAETVLRQ